MGIVRPVQVSSLKKYHLPVKDMASPGGLGAMDQSTNNK